MAKKKPKQESKRPSGNDWRSRAGRKAVGLTVYEDELYLLHNAAAKAGVRSVAEFCRQASLAEARKILEKSSESA